MVQKERIFPSLHKTAFTYSMLDDGIYVAELKLVTNAVNKKIVTFVHGLLCVLLLHTRVSQVCFCICLCTLQIKTLHLSNLLPFLIAIQFHNQYKAQFWNIY